MSRDETEVGSCHGCGKHHDPTVTPCRDDDDRSSSPQGETPARSYDMDIQWCDIHKHGYKGNCSDCQPSTPTPPETPEPPQARRHRYEGQADWHFCRICGHLKRHDIHAVEPVPAPAMETCQPFETPLPAEAAKVLNENRWQLYEGQLVETERDTPWRDALDYLKALTPPRGHAERMARVVESSLTAVTAERDELTEALRLANAEATDNFNASMTNANTAIRHERTIAALTARVQEAREVARCSQCVLHPAEFSHLDHVCSEHAAIVASWSVAPAPETETRR